MKILLIGGFILCSGFVLVGTPESCVEASADVITASRLYNTSATRVKLTCGKDLSSGDCQDALFLTGSDFNRMSQANSVYMFECTQAANDDDMPEDPGGGF